MSAESVGVYGVITPLLFSVQWQQDQCTNKSSYINLLTKELPFFFCTRICLIIIFLAILINHSFINPFTYFPILSIQTYLNFSPFEIVRGLVIFNLYLPPSLCLLKENCFILIPLNTSTKFSINPHPQHPKLTHPPSPSKSLLFQ